jgi:hypothetical protein
MSARSDAEKLLRESTVTGEDAMGLERWTRCGVAGVVLAAAQACAATPTPVHEIVQGTDGNFTITVRAEGPAQLCRAEALRVAGEELARRRLPPTLLQETYLQSTESSDGGRRLCTAELPVSTLPPWR